VQRPTRWSPRAKHRAHGDHGHGGRCYDPYAPYGPYALPPVLVTDDEFDDKAKEAMKGPALRAHPFAIRARKDHACRGVPQGGSVIFPSSPCVRDAGYGATAVAARRITSSWVGRDFFRNSYFIIALGYEDVSDRDELRHDPGWRCWRASWRSRTRQRHEMFVEARAQCRACKHVAYCHPSASPTNRRLILPISSALSASASLMSAAACFDVLVFDPKTTMPPITAEIAPIIATESNLIAPNV
jgi:hypothetical protein